MCINNIYYRSLHANKLSESEKYNESENEDYLIISGASDPPSSPIPSDSLHQQPTIIPEVQGDESESDSDDDDDQHEDHLSVDPTSVKLEEKTIGADVSNIAEPEQSEIKHSSFSEDETDSGGNQLATATYRYCTDLCICLYACMN